MANLELYRFTSERSIIMGAVILSLALHSVFAVLVVLRMDFPVLRMKSNMEGPALQVNWISLKTDALATGGLSSVRGQSSPAVNAAPKKDGWETNEKIEESLSTISTRGETTPYTGGTKQQDSSVFLTPLNQGTAVESLPGNRSNGKQGSPVVLQASASLSDPGEGGGGLYALPHYRDNRLPMYPAIARRLGYEGTVVLSTEVYPDGRVGNVVIKRSSGFAVLDKSASEAIRRWIFEPGSHAGRPVTMWVDVPVTFRLTEKPVS